MVPDYFHFAIIVFTVDCGLPKRQEMPHNDFFQLWHPILRCDAQIQCAWLCLILYNSVNYTKNS